MPGPDGIDLPAAAMCSRSPERPRTPPRPETSTSRAISQHGRGAESAIIDAAGLDRVLSVRDGAQVAISDMTVRTERSRERRRRRTGGPERRAGDRAQHDSKQ